LETGTALNFQVTFKEGDAKLTHLSIKAQVGNENVTVVDSVLNKGIFNGGAEEVDYVYNTTVNVVDKTITFTTTDKNENMTSFTVTVSPKKAAANTYTVSSVTLMGAQANATIGSFYSVATGDVFLLKDAKTNTGLIDFVYYYGVTNKATICAPSDATINDATHGIKYGGSLLSALGMTNKTVFYQVTGGSTTYDDWYGDAITAVGQSSTTDATQLEAGNYYAFKTQAGTTGAFYVQGVQSGTNGQINIQLITKN
jgi:hypothetical protein